MRQLLIYLVLAALLLAGLGIWQMFRDTGQGALLVQKYTDINDLPSNYKDLVKAAAKALPDIGPDADFGFAASPEEVMPRANTDNPILKEMESTRNVRWLGKVLVSKDKAAPREWLYVIENGQVNKLVPMQATHQPE